LHCLKTSTNLFNNITLSNIFYENIRITLYKDYDNDNEDKKSYEKINVKCVRNAISKSFQIVNCEQEEQ